MVTNNLSGMSVPLNFERGKKRIERKRGISPIIRKIHERRAPEQTDSDAYVPTGNDLFRYLPAGVHFGVSDFIVTIQRTLASPRMKIHTNTYFVPEDAILPNDEDLETSPMVTDGDQGTPQVDIKGFAGQISTTFYSHNSIPEIVRSDLRYYPSDPDPWRVALVETPTGFSYDEELLERVLSDHPSSLLIQELNRLDMNNVPEIKGTSSTDESLDTAVRAVFVTESLNRGCQLEQYTDLSDITFFTTGFDIPRIRNILDTHGVVRMQNLKAYLKAAEAYFNSIAEAALPI